MSAGPSVVSIDETAVNVFTDGSSLPSPRRGGLAFRIVTVDAAGDEVLHDEVLPGYESSTNQEMELLAVIEALAFLQGRYSPVDVSGFRKVIIYTDSQYVADNIDNAIFRWPRDGWYGRGGRPIKNATLWKRLTKAKAGMPVPVQFRWVKGHKSGNPHNKAVDKLAKSSAKGVLQAPVSPRQTRRKLTSEATEVGSIVPEGQRLSVRVIHEEWLPEQKIGVYKCEVTSTDSPYLGKVDNLYTELPIRRGHTYDVQLNENPSFPRIERVHGEVQTSSGNDA